jgi:glycosyl transferase family 1
MRLFQNSSIYAGYVPRLRALVNPASAFGDQVSTFLGDRYAASHLLKPVLDAEPSAFFTNGNDRALQASWAREHGLKADSPFDEILLAQIEEHRTEVFYNLDPVRFGDDFLSRLPGCVKRHFAWRAAPSPHDNFRNYHLVVSNFPGILARYAERGFRTAYFFPAHDSAMDEYAARTERPVDLLFVGGYSRHHRRRAQILEAVAALADRWCVRFHLDRSRLTRLAESPLGLLPPLRRHRRPPTLRQIAQPGVFGRELYSAIAGAKIVLNAAVDMAGEERGNMRCFEAIGCGALLLSDEGIYPSGMQPGAALLTYRDAADAVARVNQLLLEGPASWEPITRRGAEMIRSEYSRDRQWQAFVALCG